jgi:endonuclease YncB( thermonuclease family)
VYASRGDTSSIGESVARRAENIVAAFNNLFSSSSATFRFIGATELVDAHRRVKRFSLDLPFVEHLATGRDSYVLLVRLEDYCHFVTDEGNSLRRYLFDSNVRDYLGTNQVNQDIAASLGDEQAAVLVGRATKIVDGDTLDIQLDSGAIRIRLHGVDAPERGQPHGKEATAALSRWVLGKEVQVEPIEQRDGFGRLVGVVYVANMNANAELIRSGHAWAFRRYMRTADAKLCELHRSFTNYNDETNPDFSQREDASGRWVSKTCVATTSYHSPQERPDAHTV